MSSKLIPSNPAEVMVIRDITPNIVTFSVPFARFGILRVGGRATLIRLTSGALAIFSAVALTDEVKAKVEAFGGNLAYIIAPDMEHHIFVSEWKKAYPAAKIIGPAGLPEKRAKQSDEKIQPDEFFAVFDDADQGGAKSIAPDFDADFDYEYFGTHPNKELVLFYKPDRVLIEADLLFNLPAIEQYSRVPEDQRTSHGTANRLWQGLQAAEGDTRWARRFQWYLASSKDRPRFNEAVKRVDGWDFVTIIPCHGETITEGAKEKFRNVFEWHLNGHK